MNNANNNNWLVVKLEGIISNVNGIGARLEIHGDWGVQVREIRSGEGYGIMNSLDAHFGIGDSTSIDRLVIRWPSGLVQEVTDPAPNQMLRLTEELDPNSFTTPVITSPLMVEALESSTFSYRIAADNIPLEFSIANGPAGMTVSDSGTVSWTTGGVGTVTFDITATNPAGSDTETVELTVIQNPLPMSFEAEGFAVNTSGAAEWFPQDDTTHDGIDAAESGDITNNETTTMSVQVTGPGQGSFWWRVSSESGWDFLRYYIDASEQDAISGTRDWARVTFSVPAGTHTLRWEYSKDSSVTRGTDNGFVDEFSFEGQDTDGDNLSDTWEIANFGNLDQDASGDPDGDGLNNEGEEDAGTDPNDARSGFFVRNVVATGSGQYMLEWSSVPGKSYKIQGSDDLVNWVDVAMNIPATNGGTTSRAVAPAGAGSNETSLVTPTANAFAIVPSDNSLDGTWTGIGFDPVGWT